VRPLAARAPPHERAPPHPPNPPLAAAAKPTVSAAAAADAKDSTSVHYIYLCRKGAEGGDE